MKAMLAFLLLGGLAAAEEAKVEVKVYVKGMSCPTGCGTKLEKALAAVPGATSAKLANFEEGLFTVAVDAKAGVKPKEIKKAAAGFEVTKIVATIPGTVSKQKDAFVLTTASGAKIALSAAPKEECAKAAKEGEKAECPIGKLDVLLAEKKAVKVTGLLDECCAGEVSMAVVKVEACTACDAKNAN
jgi:copper chaperone CopZ